MKIISKIGFSKLNISPKNGINNIKNPINIKMIIFPKVGFKNSLIFIYTTIPAILPIVRNLSTTSFAIGPLI